MIEHLTIQWRLFLLAAICLCSTSTTRADQLIASAQQILKDQGFYYGNVDGRNGSETVAAIRQYQIRNGLKINGELDSETQRSLGVSAGQPSRSVKNEPQPPSSSQPISPNSTAPLGPNGTVPSPRTVPGRDYPQSGPSGVFAGTPYEGASPALQQQVIANVQTMLTRRGYYRSNIDGVYGSGTEFAVRAYQAQVGLSVNGRLDLETLTAMSVLPGTHRFAPSQPRAPRQRPEPIYKGEWVPE